MQLDVEDFSVTGSGRWSIDVTTFTVRHGGVDFAQLSPVLLGRVIARISYVISAHVVADGRSLSVVVAGPFYESNARGFVHWLVEELKTVPADGDVAESCPHPQST
ncbi:MAG TPA: hypothetical protein VK694_05525 [Verrucomicrobiae bacterium]|nr:hypothetical protein [Verrucomicrobiae bacterium]